MSLTLRQFNNLLTVAVIGLSLYMIALPFLPHLVLARDRFADNTNGVRYSGLLAEENGESDNNNLQESPDGKRLVIPSISIDEEVVIGDSPNLVHQGAWHRPRSSTPDQGGNTVIVGHRFSYSDPAVFYHLDKIKLGDTMAVWWEGTEYVYRVVQTHVVDASAIEIEANTDEPILTIYTCTPVWTAEDRLVIKAELVNTEVLEEETDEEI